MKNTKTVTGPSSADAAVLEIQFKINSIDKQLSVNVVILHCPAKADERRDGTILLQKLFNASLLNLSNCASLHNLFLLVWKNVT